MADNIAVTAGSGTTLATDDRSSVHYQKVVDVGGTTGASGQTTVTNSSTTVKAATTERMSITLVNYQTVAVFVDPGGGTATTSNFRLNPGDAMTIATNGAVTAITAAAYTASGDAKVHWFEDTT